MSRRETPVVVLSCIDALIAVMPARAQCEQDPSGECTEPCPVETLCGTDADCAPGATCLGFPEIPCQPSGCFCSGGEWACETNDCANLCVPVASVPTLPAWGLITMILALLTAAVMALHAGRGSL